jgi:hypothetical protein
LCVAADLTADVPHGVIRDRVEPVASPAMSTLIERFFNKIKQCRRVATRYDKLAANYLAFINPHLAMR